MTNLRFVMTGRPGAGKTTTLEALAAWGVTFILHMYSGGKPDGLPQWL
jgi:predicted ATPase